MTALLVAALLAATPHPIAISPAADGAVTGVAAAGWGGLALFSARLAPSHCRWCDRAPDGSDALNRLDLAGESLIAADRGPAELWSNLLEGALPVGAAGSEWALAAGDRRLVGEDLLVIGEVVAVQGLTNEIVKLAAARQRPYAHLGLAKAATPEDNVSFYSGHTSTAFALVTAAGTLAALRGYSHAGWVWAVGVPLATTIGVLRIAAGKHYVTDVLIGAAVGSAMGVGIPLLFHGRTDPQPAAASSRSAPAASIGFALPF